MRDPKVSWKLLSITGSVFLTGCAAVIWADSRYAKAVQVEADQKTVHDELRDIRNDIKELLRRVR